MKRYTIELTEAELMLIANCVEDIHRYAAGEADLLYTHDAVAGHCSTRKILKEWFKNIQQSLLNPELSTGQCYDYAGNGAPTEQQRKFIADTYQLYRTLRYFKQKASGAKSIVNVYNEPALPVAGCTQPKLIKVEER